MLPPSWMVGAAVGVDVDLARQPLVNAAEVDHQDAVDEHERVVVAEELQIERAVEGEQVARLDGEPGVVVPALRAVESSRRWMFIPNQAAGSEVIVGP